MLRRGLDKRQIKRSFANATQSYDAMATLQRQVGHELLTRIALPYEALVIDVGCGTGFFTQQLIDRTLLKNIIALDIALPMLLKTRNRLKGHGIPLLCADAESLPIASHSIDGLVANLALQWCVQLDKLFVDIHRVLQTDGLFAFSLFGKGTLCELKLAWAEIDDYPHVNDFYSLLEIKQHLQKAGFADVQLEHRLYQVKYHGVIELMRELKGIGAHNVNKMRNKYLTAKGRMQALLATYPMNDKGKIIASYEVIYVHTRSAIKV